jgi:hypothetical protein
MKIHKDSLWDSLRVNLWDSLWVYLQGGLRYNLRYSLRGNLRYSLRYSLWGSLVRPAQTFASKRPQQPRDTQNDLYPKRP